MILDNLSHSQRLLPYSSSVILPHFLHRLARLLCHALKRHHAFHAPPTVQRRTVELRSSRERNGSTRGIFHGSENEHQQSEQASHQWTQNDEWFRRHALPLSSAVSHFPSLWPHSLSCLCWMWRRANLAFRFLI